MGSYMQLLELQESLRFLLPGVVWPEKITLSLDILVLAIRMWLSLAMSVREKVLGFQHRSFVRIWSFVQGLF